MILGSLYQATYLVNNRDLNTDAQGQDTVFRSLGVSSVYSMNTICTEKILKAVLGKIW